MLNLLITIFLFVSNGALVSDVPLPEKQALQFIAGLQTELEHTTHSQDEYESCWTGNATKYLYTLSVITEILCRSPGLGIMYFIQNSVIAGLPHDFD